MRRQLPRPRVSDPGAEVSRLLGQVHDRVRPGMAVAVAVGSRGIADLVPMVRSAVAALRHLGVNPFIVAAMGSHGGGTAAGQTEVLAHLGITAEAVGAPLRITDQAVQVGRTADGHVLWCDAEAVQAGGILLINRVKPHTSFSGVLESGLFKMMAVGLGKVPGATQVHKLGATAIYPAIRAMGRLALERLPLLGGIALVENGYEDVAKVELLLPEGMEAAEEALLEEARRHLPGLPVDHLDLLIVEEMGKNYSGTGMDTNVIGRRRVSGMPEPEHPCISRVVVLGLSAASGGNANGLGLADFVTRRLVAATDWPATYLNVRTTGFWARAFCPPVLETDREAIEWAVGSLRLPDPRALRGARIRNTLQVDELWVTGPVMAELAGHPEVTVAGRPAPLRYDAGSALLPGE